MGVQALLSEVPGNLRSHRNLTDHGQGRQLFQKERVGQDGRSGELAGDTVHDEVWQAEPKCRG